MLNDFPLGFNQMNLADNITEHNYTDLEEFKTAIFAFVKLLLYRSEFIKVIEFLERKMQNFFVRHEQFKLFLYKSHFFNLILNNESKEDIEVVYKEYIYTMIQLKSNFEQIRENLRTIAENPQIVKSRCYRRVWEECCVLFQIGIELAVKERLKKDRVNQASTCCNGLDVGEEKCTKCTERWWFRNKCGKWETIEEDIWWLYYKNGKGMSAYEYSSSSEDDKQILNYALYMNKISNISRNNVGRCSYRNNDVDVEFSPDYSMPFEANDIMLMEISEDEAKPINANCSATTNNHPIANDFSCNHNTSDKSIAHITKASNPNNNGLLFKVNPKSSKSIAHISQSQKMCYEDDHNPSNANTTFNNKTSIHSANSVGVRFITNTINTSIFDRSISMSTKPWKSSMTIIRNSGKQHQNSHPNTSSPASDKWLQKWKWKEYQFKFTKRENVDKKILRKFRKYLKTEYKKHNTDIVNWISQNNSRTIFWFNFIKYNLLPPFTYNPENKEFKSFSTAYMFWIFEHTNSIELYNCFLKTNFHSWLNHFTRWYHWNNSEEDYAWLKSYISIWGTIFGNCSTTESTVSSSTNNEFIFEDKPNPNSKSNCTAYHNNTPRMNSTANVLNEDDNKPFDIFKEWINSTEFESFNKTSLFNSKSFGYIQETSTISNWMVNCEDREEEQNEYDENDEDFYSDSN